MVYLRDQFVRQVNLRMHAKNSAGDDFDDDNSCLFVDRKEAMKELASKPKRNTHRLRPLPDLSFLALR